MSINFQDEKRDEIKKMIKKKMSDFLDRADMLKKHLAQKKSSGSTPKDGPNGTSNGATKAKKVRLDLIVAEVNR
jgi:hypothetical protein